MDPVHWQGERRGLSAVGCDRTSGGRSARGSEDAPPAPAGGQTGPPSPGPGEAKSGGARRPGPDGGGDGPAAPPPPSGAPRPPSGSAAVSAVERLVQASAREDEDASVGAEGAAGSRS